MERLPASSTCRSPVWRTGNRGLRKRRRLCKGAPAPAGCYADQATGLLEDLAPVGSTVQIVADSGQPDRDRYDRLLRYVDHDDVDVAHELLARGAARRYEAAQDLAREDSYSAAADDAQEADRGLWGTC